MAGGGKKLGCGCALALLAPVLLALCVVMPNVTSAGASAAGGANGETPKIGIEEYLTQEGAPTEGAKYYNYAAGGNVSQTDSSATPWCASFASWCLNEAGLVETGYATVDAAAGMHANYYSDNPDKGSVYEPGSGYTPVPGDLYVRNWNGEEYADHIGIVAGTCTEDTGYIDALIESASDEGIHGKRKAHLKAALADVRATDGMIMTVEGNTGDSSGSGEGGNSLGIKTPTLDSMTNCWFLHPYGGSFYATGSGEFTKYDLTDDELKQIASICVREQGSSIAGVAAEASLIANIYEMGNRGFKTLPSFVRNCGWWGSKAGECMDERNCTSEQLAAVRTVLNDGKRTLPKYVNEHDWLKEDIDYVIVDGKHKDKYDRSNYIQHKTKIHQDPSRFEGGGTTYYFFCFPNPSNPECDPFGYTSKKLREKYGDECYSLDKSGKVVSSSKKKSESKIGWLSDAKGAKVTKVSSSKFEHGNKNRANQKYIMLHDTEVKGAGPTAIASSWKNSGGGYIAAHFVIGRDGTIVQCVSLDQIAHHAGYGDKGHNKKFGVIKSGDDEKGVVSIGSKYPDYGMNSCSIGIEICHASGESYTVKQLQALDKVIAAIDSYFGFESTIIDHKAWRTSNSDTSKAFAKYLKNYKQYRSYRKK